MYKFGFLGLIPLVGFFTGLYYFILGLAKYKNRKLAIIGLLGMLFSVGIYGSMFYYMLYSDAGRRAMAEGGKTLMNSLVSEIELYKLKMVIIRTV